MIRSQEKLQADAKSKREDQPQKPFPQTREEVQQDRKTDPMRADIADVIHQQTHVKKTWTHGH